MTPVKAPASNESIFDRTADYVSAAMGRPANIVIWLVLVVGWTGLFAAHIVSANANFLPGWFTGTAFNFPLNLVTTVAELFIGFLVAAAANRSERNLELTLAAIAEQEEHIEDVPAKLSEELASNTALTQQIHEMASEIHTLLKKLAGYHSHEFSRVTSATRPSAALQHSSGQFHHMYGGVCDTPGHTRAKRLPETDPRLARAWRSGFPDTDARTNSIMASNTARFRMTCPA